MTNSLKPQLSNNKMNLGFITPINHMEYAEQGDFLYILTHLLGNEKYLNYIKKSNMYKIIDNSVHEGQELALDDYYKWIEITNPNEIVLQDVMDDCNKTLLLKEYQYTEYKEYCKGKRIMAVLQGKTLDEIMEAYDNYMHDAGIDVIGLSFTLTPEYYAENKYITQYFNRLLILTELWAYNLKRNSLSKPVHLLGSNCWLESTLKHQFPFIRSNDTKLLSRCAKQRTLITDLPIGKPKEKLNMDETFDLEQKTILQTNIDLLKRLVV